MAHLFPMLSTQLPFGKDPLSPGQSRRAQLSPDQSRKVQFDASIYQPPITSTTSNDALYNPYSPPPVLPSEHFSYQNQLQVLLCSVLFCSVFFSLFFSLFFSCFFYFFSFQFLVFSFQFQFQFLVLFVLFSPFNMVKQQQQQQRLTD